MPVDFIANGAATGVFGGQLSSGSPARRLLASGFNPRVLQPWESEKDGNVYVSVPSGQRDDKGRPIIRNQLIHNAPATLRKEEWIFLDDLIVRAARTRLRLWSDLRAAVPRNVPNAMGHPVVQHQTSTDFGTATISMDGLRVSERDRPHFDTVNLPLPIIHSDFWFSLREIAVSRNQGGGLDTTGPENAARRVAEEIEKLALGVSSSYSYGGGTVYGLTNFPSRLTKVLTLPTAAGWEPSTTYTEVLDMIQQLNDDFFFGPFVIYLSKSWFKYAADDYSAMYPNATLLSKLQAIPDVSAVRTVDYLTGFQILVVQMTSDVVQAISGMDINTLTWETEGGMMLNFKVMAIQVPRMLSNSDGNTGIMHGTAA